MEKCYCSEQENIEHIYTCKLLDKEQVEIPYSQLYNGSIENQISVYLSFRKNMNKREKLKNEKDSNNLPNVIPKVDPQSSGIEYCNRFHK